MDTIRHYSTETKEDILNGKLSISLVKVGVGYDKNRYV